MLGNWWSRYWAYTQDELTDLMRQFQERDVPLSVCIIDMDWHIVTNPTSTGWTGYTWNHDLFPEPAGFIDWLHQQGLRTALNLHPADGVHPHEAQYEAMAERVGVDPARRRPIPFQITNPRFLQAYFELLHHPYEADGVDFWWLDWQQGTYTPVIGLDPLAALNHWHFHDSGRDGENRPVIFSRWAGLGNHRYPIGFSGDTVMSWESLAFQPYFTATAANVGYGWWSHDIGGHYGGVENAELYARWVQFGVFSPIFRLHSTKNAFHIREPWGHDATTFAVAQKAMQLRHRLIPYLYSMAWLDTITTQPLIRPMYHQHPDDEAAYHCLDQYYFGTELIAAPFTQPADSSTNLSRQVIWLPAGSWFNFFTGQHYEGNRWHAIYGGLDDIPVFAHAGAIIPLAPTVGWGGVDNPTELELHIFAGADNKFTLHEDDGLTTGYQNGQIAHTTFIQNWQNQKLIFTIAPVSGNHDLIPTQRTYTLIFHGVKEHTTSHITRNGQPIDITCTHVHHDEALTCHNLVVHANDTIVVTLSVDNASLLSRRDRRIENCEQMIATFNLNNQAKVRIAGWLSHIFRDVAEMAEQLVHLDDAQIQALIEIILSTGVAHITSTGDPYLILWNNQADPRLTYQLSVWDLAWNYHLQKGKLPGYRVIHPHNFFDQTKWKLRVNYCDLSTLQLTG